MGSVPGRRRGHCRTITGGSLRHLRYAFLFGKIFFSLKGLALILVFQDGCGDKRKKNAL